MAVSATLVMGVSAIETLSLDVPAAAGATVRHTGFDETIVLNGASTPAITGMCAFVQALTAGSATIDLTNLTGTNGGPVSGNGKKVRAIKWLRGADANPMTIVPGASNGINLFGTASSLTLYPSSSGMYYFNDNSPVIGGGAKTLDLAGTGAQSVSLIILFG